MSLPHRGVANIRGILANATGLIGAEVGTRAVSFVTILYLSRTLAPEGLGTVEFGLATFAALQIVTAGGTDVLFTHEATRRPRDVPRLAGRSLLLAWSQCLAAMAVLATVAPLVGLATDVRRSALLFGAAAAIVPGSMRFAFVADGRPWVIGAGALAGYLVYLGLCTVVVREAADVSRVAFCWIAAVCARCALPFVAFVREYGRVVLVPRVLGADLRRAAVLGAGSVARGLLVAIDVLVVGTFWPAGDVARYALAAKVPLFLCSLASLVYLALFPVLARVVATSDTRRFAAIEGTVLAGVLGAAVPGAICLGLVAEPLVVLLFTARFEAAAPLFAVLVWRLPVAAVAGFHRTALWAESPGRDARTTVHVLAVTAGLLLLVVPWAGVPGAAACMLASDAYAVVLYGRAVRARAPGAVGPGALARVAAAGGLAACLMLLVPRDAGAVAVGAALAVWAVTTALADLPVVRRVLGASSGVDRAAGPW